MTTLQSAHPVDGLPSVIAVQDERSDIELLHRISTELIGEQDLKALYGKIVDAAVSITGSQFGTMQLLCPVGHSSGHGGELQLLCSRGLPEEAVGFWQWVNPSAHSSCTMALRFSQRAIIPDYEQWSDIAGTEDLQAFRRTGIRSAQTTPLLARNGNLLGMISTHWSTPHQPTERDLRLLDILARQAADLLERTIAEEALRQAEMELRRLNESLEQRVAERTTELMQAEEKLRQSQKMEAVGQLTGGLAHDFNNLLTGISGSLELMEMRIAQGRLKDIDKYIVAAQGAAKRAAALTHRLLAFSRRQTLDPRPTDINVLVAGMSELIQRTAGPGVELETLAASDLWTTLVDVSQLENSLLNLCLNARDAMPEGGCIVIATANQRLDGQAALALDLPAGDYISLAVSDTGTGMSAEVIAKAFDPFFTTKPIGQGTGLGLSMIYGFAQQSGGQVRIQSQVGVGTTLTLYLPRHLGQAQSSERVIDSAPAVPAETAATILIVDDEPSVRMLLADVLGELGYTLVEAGDSVAGLQVLRSDVHIDLLITDVGLPGGMSGRQMSDAGHALRRDLKTLFITGYAQTTLFDNAQAEPAMQVMTKPFSTDALIARVRDLLRS